MMTFKRLKLALTAFLVALSLVPPEASAQTIKDKGLPFVTVADRTLVEYIRPAFKELQEKTATLNNRLTGLCKTPDVTSLETAKNAFKASALAFARIEMLRFGPLIEKNRFERLYFWPDRRGLALKRVQQALLEQDASVLSPQNLAQKSIALQGLGGIEFLLFGKGSEEILTDSFRCNFAAAISARLQQTAKETADAWHDPEGYSALLLNPGPENPAYRTGEEVGTELYNVLKNGVEAIKVLKLKPILGATINKARPKRAPLWRSGLSIDMIRTNLEALSLFEKKSGLFDLLPAELSWIANADTFEYDHAIEQLSHLDQPIAQAVSTPGARAALTYTQTVMDNLTELYLTEFGPALGLSAGFNALDGD